MSTAAGEGVLRWLDAAIATREQAAQAATAGPWSETGIGDFGWTVSAPSDVVAETAESSLGLCDATHIALHDPESVLRRCAADRKILERHVAHRSGSIACSMHCDRSHPGVAVCDHDGRRWPCPDITDLAEGYGWTGGA